MAEMVRAILDGRKSMMFDHDRNITRAAPIARKLIGQPIGNLVAWMKKQGGFVAEKIGYQGKE